MTDQEDRIETFKFLLDYFNDARETGDLQARYFVTAQLKVPDDTSDKEVLSILDKRINTVKTSIKFGI